MDRFLPHRAQVQRTSDQMATNSESPKTNLPQWIIQIENDHKNEESKSQSKITLEYKHKNEKQTCIYRYGTFQDRHNNYTPRKIRLSPYYYTPESISEVHEMVDPALPALSKKVPQFRSYYKAVEGVYEEMKMSYEQLDPVWENDKEAFLELMCLSGCYLLELLRCITDDSSSKYESDNPLLRAREVPKEKEDCKHDMMLLQNQLPMQLLLELLKAEGCNNVHLILGKYIAKAFSLRESRTIISVSEGKHILDVVRKAIVGFPKVFHDINTRQTRSTGSHLNIPTATELDKAGIRVTTSNTTFLADISFERRTLKIPEIFINPATISRFLNMVVFEDHYNKVGNVVTSYLYFIRFLVRDKEDVILLQKCGVINTPMNLDEVLLIFQRTFKNTKLDSDHLYKKYFQVGRQLKKRYDELSVEWKKDLRLKYLKSPWTIISVAAAILLFALTAIQTVFAVMSYFHPK